MYLIALYLLAVVLANLTVAWFGPGISILNAFVFIAFDLTTRDTLHERWNGRGLWWRMALLIATGSILSWLLNAQAGQIAIASFTAFTAASCIDALVYTLLHSRPFLIKSNGSNLLSAAVDSLVFPIIAFGWPPLWGIVVGQFVAKVAGGLLWSVILNQHKAQHQPQHAAP